MNKKIPPNIIERADLRERLRVFQDGAHEGAVVVEMLDPYCQTDAMVLAIPAGGVPVAAVIAEKLEIPLEVAVVSKITLRRTPRHAMVPHRPLLSPAHWALTTEEQPG